MSSALRGLRAAFVFLTRLPMGKAEYQPGDWQWANAYFPLVGAVVGALSAGVYLLAEPLGSWVAAVLALSASLLITGAFHEDGLADSADALGGGLEKKDRVLEILKDSRLGTYGSSALVLSILLRVALIEALDGDVFPALVVAHGLARFPPVAMKTFMPYLTQGDAAKSRDLIDGERAQLALAAVLAILITAWGARSFIEFGLLWLVAAVVGAFLAYRFQRRLGGYTGDFLGATEQFAEVALLIALVAGRL